MVNKILKKVIDIPSNVSISLKNNYLYFSGPKGKVEHEINKYIIIEVVDNKLNIGLIGQSFTKKNFRKVYPLINTTFVLLKNCIYGVLYCFNYALVIKGIGYKAEYNDKNKLLELFIGFSHSIKFDVPNDISVNVIKNVEIYLESVSKYRVSQFAANIRAKRVTDAYKGNGIRYKNEIVSLKNPKKSK